MNIVSRQDAGLSPPRGNLAAAKRPAKELLVHHSVTFATPEDHGQCAGSWKHVQSVAFSRSFTDVSYHYGICPHGVVFEGRKADRRGAHCDCPKGHNTHSLGVVVIGNYETFGVTPEIKGALAALIDHLGVPRSEVWTHRRYKATACPGANLVPVVDDIRLGATPASPTPTPTTPTSPATDDWTEGVIMALPTLDLRTAHQNIVRHQLVDNLQGLLKATQHKDCDPGDIDGLAGAKTKEAVLSFQTIAGLGNDAIVGKQTWAKLINW